MEELYQVFIEMSFLGRLKDWDTDSQVELDALQIELRESGWEFLLDAPSACSIKSVVKRATGEIHWIQFDFNRGDSVTLLVLEVREPHVLVLWDRVWP